MKINKKYQIEVIKDKDKTLFIVYATDIYSPSEFFSKIESDLKKKKVVLNYLLVKILKLNLL